MSVSQIKDSIPVAERVATASRRMSMSGLVSCSGAGASSIQPPARPWRDTGCRPSPSRAGSSDSRSEARSCGYHSCVRLVKAATTRSSRAAGSGQRGAGEIADLRVRRSDEVTLVGEAAVMIREISAAVAAAFDSQAT